MTDEGSHISKKRKKPDKESEIEEQVQNILKSTEVPDIGNIDINGQIRDRLKDADAAELDSLEKELGIPSDSDFCDIINKDEEVIFKPLEQIVENQKTDAAAVEMNTENREKVPFEERDEKTSIDGSCTVTVNEDKMGAVIDLNPSEGNGRPLNYEMVNRELKAKGVVYGVNTELLKKLIQNVEKTKDMKRGVIIAQGTLPVQGKNGSIEFHFSDDESVLFKEDNGNEDTLVT